MATSSHNAITGFVQSFILAAFIAVSLLILPRGALGQGFAAPPPKGNCDPRFCHEFGNCLADGGFGDISISPKQVAVGETITITFSGPSSPPNWPAGLGGNASPTTGRGGKFIRWQSQTMGCTPRPYPTLAREGDCAGQTSCEYRVTSAGLMEEDDAIGGRPWAIVRLDFTVPDGRIAWDEDYFGVVGKGPQAEFSFEISEEYSLDVLFDASASSDAEGDIVEYAWDFDGDGEVDAETEEVTITHRYEEEGDYQVTLTVTDNDDLESDPFSDEVSVEAVRWNYAVELENEAEEGGNKADQDDEPVVTQVGETVLVRVGVENTGAFPLQDIQVVDGPEGIVFFAEQQGALVFTEARQLTIPRLEPGESGEMVFAHEAVHAVQAYTCFVAELEATSVNPNTGEEKRVTAIASPCQAGNKQAADPDQDDKKRNEGCVQGATKAAGMVVNSTGDDPQGRKEDGSLLDGCDTGITRDGEEEAECTLRAAIEMANARSEATVISFDLPGAPATILLGETLRITGAITVDATAQAGYSGHPVITLGGSASSAFDLQNDAAVVRGFKITGFQTGVQVSASGTTLEGNHLIGNSTGVEIKSGGENTLKMNVISGNGAAGILITGGGNNKIQNNLIGTDETGNTSMPNRIGILITNGSSMNQIGGSQAEGNTIAGNTEFDIGIQGDANIPASASGNTIQGNYIGLNSQGNTVLGRGFISLIGTHATNVGGAMATRNYFSAIDIDSGDGDFIIANAIGVLADDSPRPLLSDSPGAGIALRNTSRVRVEGNLIRNKLEAGIVLANGTHRTAILENDIFDNRRGVVLRDAGENNTIRRNSIHDNRGLGIDHKGNDKPDVDTGFTRHFFPFPPTFYIVTSRRVEGFAPRGDVAEFIVDVYTSDRCDGSGYGEGASHLGSFQVAAGEDFNKDMPAGSDGKAVTFTATEYKPNLPGLADGGTTEFSKCFILPDRVAQANFDPNATGPVMDDAGVRVTATGSATAKSGQVTATLYASQYRAQPERNAFAGAAHSDNGSLITPDAVRSRYFYLTTNGLADDESNPIEITYDLCLDATNQTSNLFFPRLLLLQRNEETDFVWIPHDTRIEEEGDTRYACALGLTTFGEFTFALGEETTLAAPQLVAPDNAAEDISERPVLSWEGVAGSVAYVVQVSRSVTFAEPDFTAAGVAGLSVEAETAGPGLVHYWRVRGVEALGMHGPWSLPRSFRTGGTPVEAEDEAAVSSAFVLGANYPNPFNPQTVLPYVLPRLSEVRLAVYDVLGREVAVLVEGTLPAGRHEAVFEATGLPTGVYIYRMQAGTFSQTRRMLLVK